MRKFYTQEEIDRQIAEAKANMPANAISAEVKKEEKPKFIDIKVVRETEKAVACEYLRKASFYSKNSGGIDVSLIWIPKSMLVDGRCPAWFYDKKVIEVAYSNK